MDICAFTSPGRNESKREIEHQKEGDKRHYKPVRCPPCHFRFSPGGVVFDGDARMAYFEFGYAKHRRMAWT